jgi:NOL1/NOP2/sun family putative RNA methylase
MSDITVCQNLPEQFQERLHQLLTDEQYQQVMEAFASPRLTTFRANTLKISANELEKELTATGIPLEQVQWWPNALKITDPAIRQIFHELYRNGSLYVQSLSSMLPPLVLDPQPGEKILDITAAPGSKTTQMAALMNNEGEILANDLSPVRLFKLQANLKMQGVTNTRVRRGPGEYIWKKFPEYFDRTLVDVPCTMEGRIDCTDPDSYADWSMKKIKQLTPRQCHLLRAAVSATKPGGIIVYSTCTLAPEENEAVVNWLIEKEQGRVVLEDIDIPGVPWVDGITHWQKKEFSPEMTKTKRVLPNPEMEGFYVAKLRKLSSNLYSAY